MVFGGTKGDSENGLPIQGGEGSKEYYRTLWGSGNGTRPKTFDPPLGDK